MARTTQKARKSTGARANTRKTLKERAPTIESKDVTASKRSRTSDAADKVDPKRARILVDISIVCLSLENNSLITNRILTSRKSVY
jgi:hypothetical protein